MCPNAAKVCEIDANGVGAQLKARVMKLLHPTNAAKEDTLPGTGKCRIVVMGCTAF